MLLCGCASDMFLEKRDAKLGPYATTYWRDKDTRQKSAREVEEFDEQLQLKVDKYIAIHPELPEEVKKWMSYLHVVVGMNKEQVLMLLGTPYKKKQTSERGTDEVWIYRYLAMPLRDESHLYFKGDTLVKIIDVSTRLLAP